MALRILSGLPLVTYMFAPLARHICMAITATPPPMPVIRIFCPCWTLALTVTALESTSKKILVDSMMKGFDYLQAVNPPTGHAAM